MKDEDLLRSELNKGEESVFMLIDESVRGIVETSTPFAKLVNSKGQIEIGDSIYQIKQNQTVVTHFLDFSKNDFSKSTSYPIERIANNGARSDLAQCNGFVNNDVRRKITGLIFDTNYVWSRHQGAKTKIEKKTGAFGSWVSWEAKFLSVSGTIRTRHQFTGAIFTNPISNSTSVIGSSEVSADNNPFQLNSNVELRVISPSTASHFGTAHDPSNLTFDGKSASCNTNF